MRSFSWIITFGLIGSILLPIDAKATTKFSEPFSKIRPAGVDEPFALSARPQSQAALSSIILEVYFQPSNLTQGANLRFLIDTKRSSCEYNLTEHSPGVTDQDLFYCKQTLWEATPLLKERAPATFDYTFSSIPTKFGEKSSYKSNFFQNYPKLNEKMEKLVVIRVIPRCAADLFPTAVYSQELNSIQNLKAISVARISSDQFRNYQKEWMDFLQRNSSDSNAKILTRSKLFNEANRLTAKYSDLFIDVN